MLQSVIMLFLFHSTQTVTRFVCMETLAVTQKYPDTRSECQSSQQKGVTLTNDVIVTVRAKQEPQPVAWVQHVADGPMAAHCTCKDLPKKTQQLLKFKVWDRAIN